MNAPSVIHHGTTTADGRCPCPCGCAPCDRECCGLECLVRPHYFCGQLLTDADLTALVDWSRARFALSRYRDGWGVVSGLSVTLDPDDRNRISVRVGEGYAVDCCGNDIVVCEPFTQVLKLACPTDDCVDPWAEPELRGVGKANQSDGRSGYKKSDSSIIGRVLENAHAVDLFLHYQEEGTEPQTALHRDACGRGDCQNSRVREGYRVDWQPADDRSADTASSIWMDRYQNRRAVAQKFARNVSDAGADLSRVQDLIEAWLRDRPTGRRYEFAYEWVRRLSKHPDQGWLEALPEVVFWLVMDDLESWLTCDSHDCDRSVGIPLARIWLGGRDAADRRPCRIVAIDDRSPWRRPLRRDDCLPAPIDCVNLGRFIGERWDTVAAELAAAGIELDERDEDAPIAWSDLTDESDLVFHCRKIVKVRIADPGGIWGARVVGFSGNGIEVPA